MDSPKLIEPGVKYYINSTLQKCNNLKQHFNYILFNFYYLVIFILLIGGFLIFKYKGKLTDDELKEKKRQEKQVIFTNLMKINKLKKNMETTHMITGLPLWNNSNSNFNQPDKIYL